MLAKDLAKAIEQHKGIVFVKANWTDETWVQVVKKDLIRHFRKKGDKETGLKLDAYSGHAYIDADYDYCYEQLQRDLAEREY